MTEAVPRQNVLKPDGLAGGVDRSIAAGAVLLAILVLAAFSPALTSGFVWDDATNVTENRTLRSWGGLLAIWFRPGATQQYYPLTHTAFWLEYRLWGLAPLGYHLVNIALQIANATLLWRLLYRLRVPGAYLAAAVFAVHPLQVETVVYVTEQKNLLSALLCLAATLKYLRFDATRRGRELAWAAGLFVCALLSKTVVGPWPVLVALLLVLRHGRLDGFHIRRLLALLLMAVPFCAATVWLEVHHVGSSGAAWGFSWAERTIIAGRALWFYALKLFWPHPLMLVYPRWVIVAADPVQYVLPALAAAVPVAAWLSRKRLGPGPWVAACGFGLTLGPVLGFFNVYYMRYSFVRDHFQYLAGIFVIAFSVAALHRLSRRWGRAVTWIRRAGVSLLVAALALLSLNRSAVYHDPETIWRDTIALNPDAWVAYHNLGAILLKQQRYDEARSAFVETLDRQPEHAKTYHNLGMLCLEEGKADEAAGNFEVAFTLDPRIARAAFNLGVIRQSRGDRQNALVHFIEAAASDPTLAGAQFNAAVLLEEEGALERAIVRYQLALAASPSFAERNYNLAIAVYRVGRYGEAWTHLHAARRLGMPLPPQFQRALSREQADPSISQVPGP